MAALIDKADCLNDDGAPDDVSRRERIIAAADELLTEDGLDGLTIRAVLQRTGFARRALYDSFVGKDDLVLAVFARAIKQAAEHFAEQFARLDNPLDRIRIVVDGIVLGPLGASASAAAPLGVDDVGAIDRRSTAFSREHLRLAEARPDDLGQALRPLLDLITGQVALGMRAGALRRGDPKLCARLIYNLVATTTHTELLTSERSLSHADRRTLADAIWAFCRQAIVG